MNRFLGHFGKVLEYLTKVTLVYVNCASSTAFCRLTVRTVHFLCYLLSQLINYKLFFELRTGALRG